MTDPFLVEGPACVSFSGGRSSGLMLRRILDAHGGALPADVVPVFANTGRERPETLDFVQECAERWDVRVRWVEWQHAAPKYREVTHATASRDGEPFAELIARKNYLPNPVQRFCTQYLKVEPIRRFLRALGFDAWTTAVGIRHDEPRRWRALDDGDKVGPLVTARVTVGDVAAFWARQPFDLRLRPHEGNCDLCFLKGRAHIERLVRTRPDLAAWWIAQEREGRTFRADRPPYAIMLRIVQSTPMLPGMGDDDDALPCGCTD